MNKYTETYLNELGEKRAFIGKAISAAAQAAKPILLQGVKQTTQQAAQTTGANAAILSSRVLNASKNLAKGSLEAAKGYASGLGTLGKEYISTLKTPGATASQKVLGVIGKTLSAPGVMLGSKPISQIGARGAGQLAGAATPLVAAGAGAYSLMPNQDLPRVPASRATFLPSHEESQYFADLWKKRTGDNLSQREIDRATLRK
jgi:hypothetical protein